jgi:hypothetical protein
MSTIAQIFEKSEISSTWTKFKSKILSLSQMRNETTPRLLDEDQNYLICEFIRNLPSSLRKNLHESLLVHFRPDINLSSINLICSGPHLPTTFPLNAFLVGLVIDLLREFGSGTVPALHLNAVMSDPVALDDGHICMKNANRCHGIPHTTKINAKDLEFNILIIRHGIKRDIKNGQSAF